MYHLHVTCLYALAMVAAGRSPAAGDARATFEVINKKLMLWLANVKVPDEIPLGTRHPFEQCNTTITSDNGHVYSHHARIALTKMEKLKVEELMPETLQGKKMYMEEGLDCTITINPETQIDNRYLLQFISDIDLSEGKSNGPPMHSSDKELCENYLQVGWMKNLIFHEAAFFCDNYYDVENLAAVEIPETNLIFKFHTQPTNASGSLGFGIQYATYFLPPQKSNCSEKQFSCDAENFKAKNNYTVEVRSGMNKTEIAETQRCIQKEFRCDKIDHCLDKSDESKKIAKCRLKHRIVGGMASLGIYGMLVVIVVTLLVTILLVSFFIRCGLKVCKP